MKRLEDIQKLDDEALEKAAQEENIPVPEGLQHRIRCRILAEETRKSGQAESPHAAPHRWLRRRALLPAAAVAAAACTASFVYFAGLSGREPKDSFEDPYLAYAQIEQAFHLISSKMASGLEATRDAAALAGNSIESALKQ